MPAEDTGTDKLLRMLLEDDVSDFHFKVGSPPMLRKSGILIKSEALPPLTREHVEKIALDIIQNNWQRETYLAGNEVDMAHSLEGAARFRVNIYRQRGTPAVVMRRIPFEIPSFNELGLPPVVEKLAMEKRGLVLVTGATGSGKSTTLAAMIDYINHNRKVHIVTIEDPIEFIYKDANSSICQREVGIDTKQWESGLRAVFRQDPDVILIGEMRDAVTAATALTGAETGHLVFSTLHTADAPETINRVIDMFPAHQQSQIRIQLGGLLKGVISQRLLTNVDGTGLVLAAEIMVHTATIRNCIVDPTKTHMIIDIIEEVAAQYGMQTFDMALMRLLSEEAIDVETALAAASNPTQLELKLGGVESPSDWKKV